MTAQQVNSRLIWTDGCVVSWCEERQVHIDRRMFEVCSWPGSSDRQNHPHRTVSSAVLSTVGPFGCRSRVGRGSQGGGVSEACAGPAKRIEASSMSRSVFCTYRIRWHVPSSPWGHVKVRYDFIHNELEAERGGTRVLEADEIQMRPGWTHDRRSVQL